jgi:DNA-binding NarL/FixJ family response regulator
LARTRILVAELPRMRRDIIADLLDSQSDMEVVGDVPTGLLAEAVSDRQADVLLIGRDDSPLAEELLERRPRLKVFAVADHGRECSLYELRPHRVEFGEVSPDELVAAIRAAVRRWPQNVNAGS